MEKSTLSSSTQEEHVHVHYHYYYPDQMRGSRSSLMEKKSESNSQQTHYATPNHKASRIRTQQNELESRTQVKKMRMSDLGKNKRQSDSSNNHSEEWGIKAKSVVQEEIQTYEEESEFEGKNSFLRKSSNTNQETESHTELQAYYESELAKFKSEIERLKMVEEECIYLRDAFYGHFTEQCPKYS